MELRITPDGHDELCGRVDRETMTHLRELARHYAHQDKAGVSLTEAMARIVQEAADGLDWGVSPEHT